jgi:4-alpha-glucanotransferase
MVNSNIKHTGILVPVFALRSENDLGIGDTQSVKEMIDWSSKHGFTVLQLLPINESGDDNSPYNAISSRALDPTAIHISTKSLPDLTESAFKQHASPGLIEELQKGVVQYRKVKKLKKDLLWDAFQNFLKKHDAKNSERALQFRSFILENNDWISDYALYRTLMEIHDRVAVWTQWPKEHQSPVKARSWILSRSESERIEIEDSILFFCYVQWIAHQQWTDLKTYAGSKNVALMGDIPFGIGRYSADVWAFPQQFDLRWSCGAPPESFFKPDLFTERWGQNWGIPLYRWDRMKEDQYSWWKSRVKGTSQIFHYFRIDHVLGFYRVYAYPWIPEDNHLYTDLSHDQARQKAGDLPRFWPGGDQDGHQRWLNEQHGEELLKMVVEASGQTGLVAEDLGMVPDYVRPSLTRLGIPGFKIPLFERNSDGSYKDSNAYPFISIATLATHDHEPVASLWKKWTDNPEQGHERQHLLNWIGWDSNQPPLKYTPELHAAICKKLMNCPSQFVIFMITDLFGQTQRFNVPGPMSDSNWTERLPIRTKEFDDNKDLKPWIKNLDTLMPRN